MIFISSLLLVIAPVMITDADLYGAARYRRNRRRSLAATFFIFQLTSVPG